MISMCYGTIPVVHATGGLADTVTEHGDQQTGFVLEELTATALLAALRRAAEAIADDIGWRTIMLNAMRQDFSWNQSAQRYKELYDLAVSRAAD